MHFLRFQLTTIGLIWKTDFFMRINFTELRWTNEAFL